jgi:beta-carotene 3-hydroxylase
MEYLLFIGVVFGVFIFMEFTAWFTHKYIMHGMLWNVHEDHHVPHDHTLEKNDFFALIFAVPSFLLIWFGVTRNAELALAAGIGVLLYGLVYFFVHDVYIHRRIKGFDHWDNTYLRAVRIAHKMHHKHLEKEPGESYGFLWVNKKYWDMARKQNRAS